MSKSYTHEEFVSKSRDIHGIVYDYITPYAGMSVYMDIRCKVHGIFNMRPMDHIHQKQGCGKCTLGRIRLENFKRLQDKVKDKFKGNIKVSCADYVNKRQVVSAECSTHGKYESILESVLKSPVGNCKGCALALETKTFFEKARALHGDKYDYSDTVYVCSRDHLHIRCKKHNSVFPQRPSAHLQEQGCPLCGEESRKKTTTHSTEMFLDKVRLVYDNPILDYSQSRYTGAHENITIKCQIHGDFTQIANNHLSDPRCPVCKEKQLVQKWKENFLCKGKQLHGDSIDYTKVVYFNNTTRVDLKCNIHDHWFTTTPLLHLDLKKTSGCPMCGKENLGRWTIAKILQIPNIEHLEGYLYTGELDFLPEGVIKIGVTMDLSSRMTKYRSDLKGVGKFSYNSHIKLSYLLAFQIEILFKKLLRKQRHKHDFKFGGKTEVFHMKQKQLTFLRKVIKGEYTEMLEDFFVNVVDNSFDTGRFEEIINE